MARCLLLLLGVAFVLFSTDSNQAQDIAFSAPSPTIDVTDLVGGAGSDLNDPLDSSSPGFGGATNSFVLQLSNLSPSNDYNIFVSHGTNNLPPAVDLVVEGTDGEGLKRVTVTGANTAFLTLTDPPFNNPPGGHDFTVQLILENGSVSNLLAPNTYSVELRFEITEI